MRESCTTLSQYARELEELLNQPITREDYVNFINDLQTNETFINAVSSATEAIGGVVGGMMVAESLGVGPILPDSINPAELLAPMGEEAGQLVGFLAAAKISWTTLNTLAQKLPKSTEAPLKS